MIILNTVLCEIKSQMPRRNNDSERVKFVAGSYLIYWKLKVSYIILFRVICSVLYVWAKRVIIAIVLKS